MNLRTLLVMTDCQFGLVATRGRDRLVFELRARMKLIKLILCNQEQLLAWLELHSPCNLINARADLEAVRFVFNQDRMPKFTD